MFPLLRFKVNVGCLLCSSDCKIRVSDLGFSVLRIYSWEERQGKLSGIHREGIIIRGRLFKRRSGTRS
ncbi:hypothetical protein LINGRAHAP2_LOCUS30918 [Linum grandiflorum]